MDKPNYKHLYEQTKLMLERYQDEIVPGLRKKIEELETQHRTEYCEVAGYDCVALGRVIETGEILEKEGSDVEGDRGV